MVAPTTIDRAADFAFDYGKVAAKVCSLRPNIRRCVFAVCEIFALDIMPDSPEFDRLEQAFETGLTQ